MSPPRLLRIAVPLGILAATLGCKGLDQLNEDLRTGTARFQQSIGAGSDDPAPAGAEAASVAPDGAAVASAAPAAKKEKRKCAAMPLEASALQPEISSVMDEIVLAELQKSGFEAIGKDDIKSMLGFEQQKSLLGCDEAGCIAEIGNALGVQFLVAGKLAAVDDSMILTLKLIDVRKAKVLARVNRMVTGGKSQLPAMISASVQELVKTAEL